MSAPSIEECIAALALHAEDPTYQPYPGLEGSIYYYVRQSVGIENSKEILRILRAVKASRDELPTRHGGLMACDGCEKRTP